MLCALVKPFLFLFIRGCAVGMLTLDVILVLIELTEDVKLSVIWLPKDVMG